MRKLKKALKKILSKERNKRNFNKKLNLFFLNNKEEQWKSNVKWLRRIKSVKKL